jgi:alpha-L-rhamnosidase
MKRLLFYTGVAITVLTSFEVSAQPAVKTDWQAQWIGDTSAPVPDKFYRYRYQFRLNQLPSVAIASIAVDSKYWLWLNGKLVVFEGGLKRGPTPRDTYYDEVDIKPFLQSGQNTIAILVWYWGKDGFGHKSSGKSGLLFDAKLDNEVVVSSGHWKTAEHPAYQNSSRPVPNFRLSEHNIRYDARLGGEEWIEPGFDDGKWNAAVVIGDPNLPPWNVLWKRPVPLWYDSGLQNYVSVPQYAGDGKMILQLPANITVTPYFKIESPAGLLIDIRTDNYEGGSAFNVRTEYITKEGMQEFESPAYFNGHKVIYSFPAGVRVIDVKYRETKFNTDYVGYFHCDDTLLNRLWQMSAATLNLNMRDGIYDCPDRERAQWWGDIVITLEEIFYACDKRGQSAVKKAISNLLEWQRADSVLFSPVPAGNWNKELPAQMLAAIGRYGIWKYIHDSGDTALITYVYPIIKRYMALWRLGSDGLVIHRGGDWDWHDWGEKIDVPLLDNAWYYMALESCWRMARHIGLKKDAANYQSQMQTVRAAVQRNFWKGNRYASNGYRFFADDRGNGLAVCAGLVSAEQWKALKPVLDTTFHAGPYLEKYILEGYFIMNDAAGGLNRMKNRYEKMLTHPWITTLWEGWEIGSAVYGGGTYNHGWTGGPLSLMSGYVAGIRALQPGYNRYSIKPQLGGLKSVSAGALTAKGFVKVFIKDSADVLRMNLETIAADGIIAIPKIRNYKKILINGKKRRNDFRFVNEDSGYRYYRCRKKDKWEIIAR